MIIRSLGESNGLSVGVRELDVKGLEHKVRERLGWAEGGNGAPPRQRELADSEELCPSHKDHKKKLQPYMVGDRYVYVTSKKTYTSMVQSYPATLGLNCHSLIETQNPFPRHNLAIAVARLLRILTRMPGWSAVATYCNMGQNRAPVVAILANVACSSEQGYAYERAHSELESVRYINVIADWRIPVERFARLIARIRDGQEVTPSEMPHKQLGKRRHSGRRVTNEYASDEIEDATMVASSGKTYREEADARTAANAVPTAAPVAASGSTVVPSAPEPPNACDGR
jgi:hypothetical protein